MYNTSRVWWNMTVSMEFEQKQIIDRVKEKFDLPHKTYRSDSINVVFERAGNERIKIFIGSATGDTSVIYLKKGETSTIGKTSFHGDLNALKIFKSIYRFKPTRVSITYFSFNYRNSSISVIQSESGQWSVTDGVNILIEDLTFHDLNELERLLRGLS